MVLPEMNLAEVIVTRVCEWGKEGMLKINTRQQGVVLKGCLGQGKRGVWPKPLKRGLHFCSHDGNEQSFPFLAALEALIGDFFGKRCVYEPKVGGGCLFHPRCFIGTVYLKGDFMTGNGLKGTLGVKIQTFLRSVEIFLCDDPDLTAPGFERSQPSNIVERILVS